ncbi:thiol:disulfide interchange protein tlpA [Weizmannia acidilactici]|uniref:peroxiredoxin family protein n=1 Tax=Weizmannia acidilactici TaxID=2607726 RepID=UPI00127CBAFA|nr:TlpA disulfide reductase family protein [Weizmannia acidilactici]GER66986.1 thiol:disulfide interchange protein tlpA [Weizmannia acidilactici]
MKKTMLVTGILLLAAFLVFVNLRKPFSFDEKNTTEKKEHAVTKAQTVSTAPKAEEGKPAPDFELTNVRGQSVKLSDFKGKKVILNFWASWCPPCKAEMPDMQKFYEKNQDVEILAVNLTNAETNENAPLNFVKKNGLTFQILYDLNGSVSSRYKAFTIPTSYIIDFKGIITHKIIGPMDEKTMAELTADIE